MVTGNPRRSPLARILGAELARHRLAIAFAFASLQGAILMDLLAPWPIKIVVDHVLLGRPLPPSLGGLRALLDLGPATALAATAGAIALIAILSGTFAYLQTYLSARIGHELVHALRRELFSHLQRLSLSFHRRSHSGDLLTKVATDTNLVRDALADWAVKAAADVMLLAGIVVVMLAMNWRLALVVVATLPVLFLLLRYLNHRIRLSAREQRHSEGRIVSRLNDVLSSMSLVQAFGRERYEQDRFERESCRSLEAGITNARTSAAVSKAVGVVSAAGIAGTVLVGGLFAVDGQLSPGELLIFIAYVNGLYKPIRDLGKLWARFSRARVSAERIAEVLAFEPEIRDRPGARDVRRLRGEIEFDRVRFAYHGRHAVLDGACARIGPGEHVALVGASGSGKSTLVSLLLRLYEPEAGQVRVDGEDVSAYTLASLRQRIGIVLQDTILTGASIRENIAYGRPEATDEDIERAARAASAHGFIAAMPEGYETVVGERGCRLSGGQRQRICLARTLIKEPDILVLDEPTSAVDAFTAAAIRDALRVGQRGITTIVIGHQFASFDDFDRVLELREGRLHDITAGQGRHAPGLPLPSPARTGDASATLKGNES